MDIAIAFEQKMNEAYEFLLILLVIVELIWGAFILWWLIILTVYKSLDIIDCHIYSKRAFITYLLIISLISSPIIILLIKIMYFMIEQSLAFGIISIFFINSFLTFLMIKCRESNRKCV